MTAQKARQRIERLESKRLAQGMKEVENWIHWAVRGRCSSVYAYPTQHKDDQGFTTQQMIAIRDHFEALGYHIEWKHKRPGFLVRYYGEPRGFYIEW